jgi:hypothetical protein
MNGGPEPVPLPGGKRTALNLLFLAGHLAVSLVGIAGALWSTILTARGGTIGEDELSFGIYVLALEARLLLFVFGGIVFFVWFHRSYANARTFGPVKHSPAYAVYSYFIPIVNMVRPYQVAQEMWRNSTSPEQTPPKRSNLILAWWLLFLAWQSVFFIAIDEMPEETLPTTAWWVAMVSAEMLAALASGFALAWVWQLRQRQKARAQIQRTSSYAVTPTPLTPGVLTPGS